MNNDENKKAEGLEGFMEENSEGIKPIKYGRLDTLIKLSKKVKIKRIIAVILFILTILIVVLAIWLLMNKQVTVMNYNVPPKDINAVKVEDEQSSMVDVEDGNGYGEVTWMQDVELSISGKIATFYFQNPSTSQLNMVVHLVVGDKELATSNLIEPGYELTKITDVDTSGLTPGTYDGVLRADNYDPETNERSIMATEMEVKVVITE